MLPNNVAALIVALATIASVAYSSTEAASANSPVEIYSVQSLGSPRWSHASKTLLASSLHAVLTKPDLRRFHCNCGYLTRSQIIDQERGALGPKARPSDFTDIKIYMLLKHAIVFPAQWKQAEVDLATSQIIAVLSKRGGITWTSIYLGHKSPHLKRPAPVVFDGYIIPGDPLKLSR